MSTTKENFITFWSNPWTRTVLPLVVVGAISWTGFKGKFAELERKVISSGTKSAEVQKAFNEDLKLLKKQQNLDDAFREKGGLFGEADGIRMASAFDSKIAKLKDQVREDQKELAKDFYTRIEMNNREQIRRMERMEEKIDKIGDKLK